MAKTPTQIIDVILVVFLILVGLVGVWALDPELLSRGCNALPVILQQGLGCR
jgi:hypothetical protein